jgi:hypothetical protein
MAKILNASEPFCLSTLFVGHAYEGKDIGLDSL